MNTMRKQRSALRAAAMVIMGVCALHCSNAADPIHRLDTWSDPDVAGWTNEASPTAVLLESKGGALHAEYQAQNAPAYVSDVIKVPIASGSVVTNVSFSLTALSHVPSKVRLRFHAAGSGNEWSVTLPSPTVGVPMIVDKPLAYSAGWSMGADGSAGQFAIDVGTMDWLGVYLLRNADIELQDYSLDDFLIEGLFYIVDFDEDRIADSWEVAHGLSSNSVADALLDNDGDGVNNYSEYRAGTDPEDSNSLFYAEIDRISAGGKTVSFELRWLSAENRGYTVWKSTDLSTGFVPIESRIYSTPPTNVYEDAAGTNQGPRFYRVEIVPEI